MIFVTINVYYAQKIPVVIQHRDEYVTVGGAGVVAVQNFELPLLLCFALLLGDYFDSYICPSVRNDACGHARVGLTLAAQVAEGRRSSGQFDRDARPKLLFFCFILY